MMQTTEETMSTISSPSPSNKKAYTLIHAILSSNLPDSEKSFDRILDEVSTIIGVASETAAHTLRLLIYYIYSSPTIFHHLRTELSSFPSGSNSEVSQLEQLPYLTAVLIEGMRFSPVILPRAWRGSHLTESSCMTSGRSLLGHGWE